MGAGDGLGVSPDCIGVGVFFGGGVGVGVGDGLIVGVGELKSRTMFFPSYNDNGDWGCFRVLRENMIVKTNNTPSIPTNIDNAFIIMKEIIHLGLEM